MKTIILVASEIKDPDRLKAILEMNAYEVIVDGNVWKVSRNHK